ncbi:MAG: VOC family protein [Actinomycetota bacterium]
MADEGVPEEFDGFVIPHLVVEGAAAAIDFYHQAFGAEEISRAALPDGRLLNAQLRIGRQPVWLMEDIPDANGGQSRSPHALGDTPSALHRFVPDTDAAVERAVEAGATVRFPPTDMFWGDRYAAVVDPFGHEWSFATRIETLSDDDFAERLPTDD